MKRGEAKNKGEQERYKHLNAELQRIARRGKTAFLSDQCKEIEANNRMGETGDLFKKIRDTKGTFQAKMGSIQDRNGMDVTEEEDIKRRWQEYQNFSIAPKGNPKPVSSHSLLPLPQPLAICQHIVKLSSGHRTGKG